MSIYYQHIGRDLWRRDGPRSIGDDEGDLRRFTVKDIEPLLSPLDPAEKDLLRQRAGSEPFPVWSIPSRARARASGHDPLIVPRRGAMISYLWADLPDMA